MKDHDTGPNKKKKYLIFCIIAIIYNVLPVDLIPDVVPLLGAIDDVIITLVPLIMGLQSVKKEGDD